MSVADISVRRIPAEILSNLWYIRYAVYLDVSSATC